MKPIAMKSSATPVLTLEEAKPRLREAYWQPQLIPFLGAGFSAPRGLPQWGELMGWMGERSSRRAWRRS